MQSIRATSCLVAAILVIITLGTGVANCQQLGDALTTLFGGLRGTLNSLLGGPRMQSEGYGQPSPYYPNQMMSLPPPFRNQFPPGNSGYGQQMGQPMWPQMGQQPGNMFG